MQITCPKCDAAIAADDLDLGRNLAKCGSCGEVFNCADQLDGLASQPSSDLVRGEVPLPKGFRVYRRANGLRIVRRWFGAASFFLAFFSLFWNGIVIFMGTMAIRDGVWPVLAFLSIFALVGFGVAYTTLASFLNSTTVTVLNGLLKITSGPIKVPGNKEIKAELLQQLYTKRHVHHNKNGTHVSFELRAQLADGRDEKLIANVPKQEQALFMEQQIEEFLGIEDRAVGGEVER